MTPSSMQILSEHYSATKALRTKLKLPFDDNFYVFCDIATGNPYKPDTISHVWSKICKLAGLKHIRLHDGRQTHATILGEHGVDIKTISERLGHSSTSFTMDTYQHVTRKMQRNAAKSFDAAFQESYNEKAEETAKEKGQS